MKAYTSFHSGQRQRSGNHKRHWFQWHGWVISLFLFSLIVSFAQPPSYNNEGTASASIATSTNSNASTLKHPLEAGDVLVKCKVITPHANPSFVKENEAYRPAHGTIQITVHQSIAPLASNAFLSMVSSHHFDGNYLFRVIHGFIVQWGIESPRANNGGDRVVKSKFPKVDIDPPPSPPGSDLRRTNIRGTLNFAGGNCFFCLYLHCPPSSSLFSPSGLTHNNAFHNLNYYFWR